MLNVKREQPLQPRAIELTAHGFQILDSDGDELVAWVPMAGVLVMDFPSNAEVHLVSSKARIQTAADYTFIDSSDCSVLHFSQALKGRQRHILANRPADPQEIRRLIDPWVEESFIEQWRAVGAHFASFWNGQQVAASHALARAVDTMSMTLRAPTGSLSSFWVLGEAGDGTGLVANDLYTLTKAWVAICPPVAVQLIKAVMSAQQESGEIPRIIRPDGFHDFAWAPTPLLARSAWVVWQSQPDRSFHDYMLPRLQRYLTWAINYFDPDWTGLPAWRDAREAWIPEAYTPGVASPDVASFLISELDALRDLCKAVPSGGPSMTPLLQYRASLSRTISGHFWDKESAMFKSRRVNGEFMSRLVLSDALPLLDTSLPRDMLQTIADHFSPGGLLHDAAGLRDWNLIREGDAPGPVREEHQLILLDALEEVGLAEQANSLRELLAKRFEDENASPVESAAACLRLCILGGAGEIQKRSTLIPSFITSLDRRRLLVSSGVVALLMVALLGLVGSFMAKKLMTIQAAETSAGLARRNYQEGNFEGSRKILEEVLESGRIFPALFLQLGNAEFRLSRFDSAEAAYRKELEKDPNAVAATLNLALTLLKSGRVEESILLYQEVTNRFAVADPVLARRAAKALVLLEANDAPVEGTGDVPENK